MPSAAFNANTRMPSASTIAYTSYPVAAYGVRLAALRRISTTGPTYSGGPPMIGALRGGSIETRELDWTPDLAPQGDAITGLLGVTVTRVDGAPLIYGDLRIITSWLSGYLPISGGTSGAAIVGWQCTASAQIAFSGPIYYKVTIIISTALGSTPRTRDIYQTVTNALG